MFRNAKNGSVRIDGTDMHYVSFGKGKEILIMLPGLGDGLTTVKGMAVPMAVMYRIYGEDYKVYVFSRKNHLKGSRLFIYRGLGHAAYEEAKDFNGRVISYLAGGS